MLMIQTQAGTMFSSAGPMSNYPTETIFFLFLLDRSFKLEYFIEEIKRTLEI